MMVRVTPRTWELFFYTSAKSCWKVVRPNMPELTSEPLVSCSKNLTVRGPDSSLMFHRGDVNKINHTQITYEYGDLSETGVKQLNAT